MGRMIAYEPGGVVSDTFILTRVRRVLLATLVAGIAGTLAELLLIGHVEGWQQKVPIVLLVAGLVVSGWHLVAGSLASARVVQLMMVAFIISGGAGVALHYQGNAAFELEMYPTMAGAELFRNTMTGATPVLAPGAMTLLGLVGLALTYRHPVRGTASPEDSHD